MDTDETLYGAGKLKYALLGRRAGGHGNGRSKRRAGKTGRVRKTTKTGLKISLIATLFCVAVVQLLAKQLIMLFEPNDA